MGFCERSDGSVTSLAIPWCSTEPGELVDIVDGAEVVADGRVREVEIERNAIERPMRRAS